MFGGGFPNHVLASEAWQILETFFFCERLSASMARSLRFELYLYTAVDSRPGPGGSRTTASCQP